MKGILVVTNTFENDSRVLKEAMSLQSAGYEITVIALHKKGLKTSEIFNHVKIHRLKLITKNWGHNPISLCLKYIEFTLRVVISFHQVDFVHCNDLDTLPIGCLLKACGKKKKVIYDAHEFEIDDRGDNSTFRKKFLFTVERFFISKADGVLTVGELIADEYARLYPIRRPIVIMNCPHRKKQYSSTVLREKLHIAPSEKLFIYQGAFMPGRGIERLLLVFETLPSHYKIVFMGYGGLEAMILEKAQRCPNIFYHPPVPYQDILTYTSSADYGLALIEDICLSYRWGMPNKFFEYINAGLPVIVFSHGEMPLIVNRYKLGFVWDEKTETFRDFLLRISSLTLHPQDIGDRYTWENQEKKLLSFYKAILNG